MIYSYLLIGQSNMAGRGNIGDVEKITDERLKMMRNACWQPLTEPISPDRPFAGVSLATSFAKSVIEDNPDVTAALIPCADGGTSMDEWAEGTPLYDNAVFCTRQAKRTSTLKAVLWHQGEADTAPNLFPEYLSKLEKMLKSLLRDIGEPNIPVLLGGLGEYLWHCPLNENLKNYAFINEQLKKLANDNRNYFYVAAKGLAPKDDFLHFDAVSLRKFGIRYYNVYKNQKSLYEADVDEEYSAFGYKNEMPADEFAIKAKALKAELIEGKITKEEYQRCFAELLKNV